ncbi:TPA: hypothetical protein ACPI87_001408 [Haemophilus influenzae]
MNKLLGQGWQECYPNALSKDEKACLRQALLHRFTHSQGESFGLQSYLRDLRIINDYPETSEVN